MSFSNSISDYHIEYFKDSTVLFVYYISLKLENKTFIYWAFDIVQGMENMYDHFKIWNLPSRKFLSKLKS